MAWPVGEEVHAANIGPPWGMRLSDAEIRVWSLRASDWPARITATCQRRNRGLCWVRDLLRKRMSARGSLLAPLLHARKDLSRP